MRTQSLSGEGWTVEAVGHGPYEASVPGCVHDALLAAGAIPDPDSPGGEEAQAFIGRTDWTWKATIEVDEALLKESHVALVFDSVDTVGDVLLNGERVGETASQFVPCRFDVRSQLRPGRNELVVELRGTLREAERLEAEHGERPVNADGAWGPYSQLRKSACNFGWDWGPCCPTCGFAGDVRIEAWSGPRITAIRPHVLSIEDGSAHLAVDVDVEHAGENVTRHLVVRGPDGKTLAATSGAGRLEVELDDPPLWWPRGFGDQALVTLDIRLDDGDACSVRTGIRTAEIDQGTDEGFTIRVNGVPVFCRGANWIPSRLFPHAQTMEDVRPLLEAACEANMNMIRVWGGGLYEPDWFHALCDELGLMVWQDFMFACATYPEHDEFKALVEEEARTQVARLSSHPSIVLWCGGNEDILAWHGWGWRERLAEGTAWGLHYWERLLPSVCGELDPTRPYWVESPYSGSTMCDPNDPDRGDRHTWDCKIEGYRDLVPRFVSEFGHQGPPTGRSIEEALRRPLDACRPVDLATRQRAWGGDQVQYDTHLEGWFGPDLASGPFEAWMWATQLLQARAMFIGCTWLRANTPRCSGALIWQLNDVWTGHSWSLLDVHHRRKPVFHAVRRAFAPDLLAIEPVDGLLSVVLVNDSPEAIEHEARIARVGFDGSLREETTCALSAPAHGGRCVLPVPDDIAPPGDGTRELLVVTMLDKAAHWFFARDIELDYPECSLALDIEQQGSSAAIGLRAGSLVRDFWIRADAIGPEATVDDGMFTMLPGEHAQVTMHGIPDGFELTPASLESMGVLLCANTLRRS